MIIFMDRCYNFVISLHRYPEIGVRYPAAGKPGKIGVRYPATGKPRTIGDSGNQTEK
jgi:hypothetical protein